MRTRSFLVDNTLGKLFTNTTTSSLATPANLIAGTILSSKTVAAAAATVAITTTRPGKPIEVGTLGTSGLLMSIGLSCSTLGTSTPVQDTIVKIKYGTTGYATATELLNTDPSVNYAWALPRLSSTITYPKVTGTYPIAFSWSNSETFYIDITQASTGAKGLSVTFTYYLG